MIIIIQKAGLTIEVDLQQVGLHLLLLLQVSQHTLEQLQINKQINKRQTSPPPPSLPLAPPPPPPSPGAHRALPRPSGANDQHRVALAVHRRPLQQLQQMSATQGRRRLHYQDAVPTILPLGCIEPSAKWD